MKPHNIYKDNFLKHTTSPGEDWGVWLHKNQPHSIDYALKYGGWRVSEANTGKVYLMISKCGNYDSDVTLCDSHSREAFPQGIDGVSVIALGGDADLVCEFCGA